MLKPFGVFMTIILQVSNAINVLKLKETILIDPVYEDAYLNFTQLTSKHNYLAETHTIVTKDGYILKTNRILSRCHNSRKYPILLMHGLFDSSDVWVVTGPKQGLGYVLADKCNDVWLANIRGTFYSRKHLWLDPDKDQNYWDHSFEDYGKYDLAANIDYIINVTKQEKVIYMGHSQGCTSFLILTSLRPEYNRKIRLAVLIAPVAWMKHITSPFLVLLKPVMKELKAIFEDIGFMEFAPRFKFLYYLVQLLCRISPEICGSLLYLTSGFDIKSVNEKTVVVGSAHLFSGVSTKNLLHFAQLIYSGKFQRYDEGKEKNYYKYGVDEPPEYDVSKVAAPVILISAKNDWVSSLEDVKTLISKLPNVLENYVVPDPSWSHLTHVWGKTAPKVVHPKILDYLEKYNT